MDKAKAVEFECLRCENRQKEEWNAKKTFHCRSCGNVAYPVDGRGQASSSTKVCRHCGTKLRSSNSSSVCASCDR
jgi:hypothetical protein